MKIAVLTSGILPIPAVQGGAVENLIDFYLEYNDSHRHHDITVYSVADERTQDQLALQSNVNHYHYIETRSYISKIRKHLFKMRHKDLYYHYTIEYYLDQALKDIEKKDYDIVIIENRPGYVPKVAARSKARIIVHLHNDFLNADSKSASIIYQKSSLIVTVSDYINHRVQTIDAKGNKGVTVWNGIDLDAFTPQADRSQFRKELGYDDDDFVIVYSGRINPEKGIEQLMQAFNAMKDMPKVHLLVIGGSFFGNTNNDDPFITRLKALAISMDNRIRFTGFIPYSQMPFYLQIADVAVIPSQWEEPFGLTCLEAMAMGLPVIVSERGGLPEVVDAHSAILIKKDADYVKQLSDALLDLFQHPDKRCEMGQHAMERSRQFSKQKYAESFFKAIGNI